MSTGINESKTLTKHIWDGMGENVTMIKGGIMMNVESVMYVKNIKFGILLRVIVKIFRKYYG